MTIRIKKVATLVTAEKIVRQKCRTARSNHLRRAKAYGLTLDYTIEDLVDLIGQQGACCYCRHPLGWDFHFDHKTPLNRPGSSAKLANLAVCCSSCNRAKGQLDDAEFRALLALLDTVWPAARTDVLARLKSGGPMYAKRRRK